MKRFVFTLILAIGVISVAFASQPERIKEPASIFYDVGNQAALPQVMSFDTQYCGLRPFSEVIYSASVYELKAKKRLPWDHGLPFTHSTKSTKFSNQTLTTMSKITESELNALKLKYKHISVITVIVTEAYTDKGGKEITEESYEFAVRRPDRGHISMLMPLAQKQEIDEFADKAVKNLVVGGNLEALEDGLVFMGVVSQLKDVIQPAQSFLAKA